MESCPANTVYQSPIHSCDDAVGYGIQSGGADLSRGAILRQLAAVLQPLTLDVVVGGVAAAVETGESWCAAGGGDTAQVEQAGDGDARWIGGVRCDDAGVRGLAEAGETTFGFGDEA